MSTTTEVLVICNYVRAVQLGGTVVGRRRRRSHVVLGRAGADLERMGAPDLCPPQPVGEPPPEPSFWDTAALGVRLVFGAPVVWPLGGVPGRRDSRGERHRQPVPLRLRRVGGGAGGDRVLGAVPTAAPGRPGHHDRLRSRGQHHVLAQTR